MVRTRFAPSPTGFMHIGNLRTAVYAYTMARHSQGQFILRIEDTDRERYQEDGVESIKNTLTKFNMDWDEYYVQSERKKDGIYEKSAKKLISDGHAFYCQCPAKNAKEEGFSPILRDPCRDKNFTSGAVKIKVPDNETISYFDFVQDKKIQWDTNTVYDATLLKSDGYPTYHLAAMTDDLEMNITHILRGHDWMPSTPIHLLVFKYLGGQQPEIGHLTDILSPKGGKLSKRRDSVFCETFLEEGYLPEALLNFVILLGWAPKDNREMFILPEFVKEFDPKGFQKSNPMFHTEKLDWFNGQYIRQKSDTEITQLVKPYMKNQLEDTKIAQIIPLIKDRLIKLSDFDNLAASFIQTPVYDLSLWSDPKLSATHLSQALPILDKVTWTKPDIETGLKNLIGQNNWKVGDFFMSLRIAICGSRQTPPLTETMLVLGRDESISRIQSAISYLTNFSQISPS
jgi:glutamyl-tRNA synthetase